LKRGLYLGKKKTKGGLY